MLETLELIYCANVDSVNLVSRKLVNLSVLSSDTGENIISSAWMAYPLQFYYFFCNMLFKVIKSQMFFCRVGHCTR